MQAVKRLQKCLQYSTRQPMDFNYVHVVKVQHVHVSMSVTNDTDLQSCTAVAPHCADTQGKSNLTVQRDV